MWTLSAVAGLVDEIRTVNPDLQALVFLNRADPRGSDNDDAVPARPVPITRDAWILDAFGLAAAQRIAPDELLDGLGPHLQGEGVIEKASSTGRKSRFETGSVTAGGTKAGRGSAGGKGAAGFVTVVTGCAGIRVADGVTSSMRTPPGPRGIGHECSIRGSIRGWRRIYGRGSLLVVPAGPPPRSKDARLRHGEGSGTWRMRTSTSIARQSMSVMAAAAVESDRTMAAWSRSRSASTGRHRVADQRSASPPPV